MATKIDAIIGGEHRVERITVTAVTGGAAQNLDGCTLHLRIKPTALTADGDAVLNLETGDGIEHLAQTGATLGQADITFTSAQTTALEALIEATAVQRQFVYDIWIIDALDQPQPVITTTVLTVKRGIYSPPP